MDKNKKKYVNWAIYFFVLLIVLEVVVRVMHHFDDALPLVEEFIESSVDVSNKVGSVKSLKLKRRDVVDGTDRMPLYKEYFYFVEGSTSSAWVTVKVENLRKGQSYAFSLISIKVD